MPIAYNFASNTAASNSSESRPNSSHNARDSKLRRLSPRCSTPSRASSKQADFSTTPPNDPFDGRLSPNETRQELIERKKREQRATWLHSDSQPADPSSGSKHAQSPPTLPLLPPADIQAGLKTPQHDSVLRQKLEDGSSIERPRSALHRGDFRQDSDAATATGLQPGSPYPHAHPRRDQWLSTSPTSPWYQPQVPTVPNLTKHETFAGFETEPPPIAPFLRQRAASYSARSLSIALQPPTSPLVNATTNSDSDTEHDRVGRPTSPDKTSRRRTFSPGALRSMRPPAVTYESSPVVPRALPNVRRDVRLPYQAHQPRRSINSVSEPFAFASPHTPSARSRRPSLASESSPLQRAPMVGRYEESILRGRMSSLPSRPLDFVAQIGVLGKGSCRSSLRCPPHVSVPFPAVFYNYGSRPGSPNKSEDGPSPYVGMIEIDSLKPPVDPTRPKETQAANSKPQGTDAHTESAPLDVQSPVKNRKRPQIKSKTKLSSQSGPSGGYRIPEKGQLQIIIKNPNKTAVKLFLIPYDLDGMQAGQKTFLRQRSYSAGPILDMPLSARKNLGTDRPEAALTNSDDPKDRPMLRYLIHINICCSGKGRFYLYKNIRVVFANRVPDGKERLRQEIQLPEPKFSTWKPDQDNTKLDPKRSRHISRFSLDSNIGPPPMLGTPTLDSMDGLVTSPVTDGRLGNHDTRAFTFPIQQPVPILPPSRPPPSRDGASDVIMRTPPSPLSDHSCRGCVPPDVQSPSRFTFERLSREQYADEHSGRRTQSPRPGEGILGLRLRDWAGSRPSSSGKQ